MMADKYTGLTGREGPLDKENRGLIDRYLEEPTEDAWQDIYSIIIRSGKEFGQGMTLWQAVLAVDHTFPMTANKGGWLRIPDPFMVRKALKYAQNI